MKKFLKDDTYACQLIDKNAAKHLFKLTDEQAEQSFKTERFIVCQHYKNNEFSVQVAFNTLENYSNNYYLVMIFDNDDNLYGYFSYPSHTIYPPVWNREFGYMCYLDSLGIQKKVNAALKNDSKQEIEYDMDPQKKCFYFTQEDPIKIPQLLKDGGKYSIISVFAWKKPELVKQAKQMMGLE